MVVVGCILLGSVLVGVGLWAGRVALEPPTDPLEASVEPVTYVVENGRVGQTISFTAVAEWGLEPAGRHSGSGVVTSVEVAPGDLVDVGTELYSVDLRPVVVAEGATPMFRQLRLRAEGEDVAQLQAMLSAMGFNPDADNGVFGVATRQAVRLWQESLGIEVTGVVEVGDVVFVQSLPKRAVLSDAVTPGARLSDGEVVLFEVPSDPIFTIPLSPDQADLVPLTAAVLVTYPAGVWNARIDRAVETEPGQLDLVLVGIDGNAVCTDACVERVSLDGTSRFRAEIVVIPETHGPVIPVGALSTDPANSPAVMLTDGSLVPVTIVESANGIAVVDGLEIGTEILVLVEE